MKTICVRPKFSQILDPDHRTGVWDLSANERQNDTETENICFQNVFCRFGARLRVTKTNVFRKQMFSNIKHAIYFALVKMFYVILAPICGWL